MKDVKTLLLTWMLTLGSTQVAAEPREHVRGKAVLPLSGLEVDLPARSGIRYRLAASFQLADAGASYDGRDVIDEVGPDGHLVAGTWVMVGWFSAGDCGAVVKETALREAWEPRAVKLWGATFTVRGGLYTLGGDLGERPSVLLCQSRGEGKQLLLQHFFLKDAPNGEAEALAQIGKSKTLERVSRAYGARKLRADILPLRRPEVRRRGDVEAVRRVTLPVQDVVVALPDDGYVWLAPEAVDGVDRLTRMAPALPEVTLEVATVAGAGCAEVIASVTTRKIPKRLVNLPPGWEGGPMLVLDDGQRELTMCRSVPGGAVLVGAFVEPIHTDMRAIAPMLLALEAAFAD